MYGILPAYLPRRNDERHGRGVMTYNQTESDPVQEKYDGEFVEGKMSGRGCYWYADGSVYDGQWLLGKMHGKGLFVYPNGNRYEGEFVDDMKDGFGILLYMNGEKYEGEWKENFAQGSGKCSLLAFKKAQKS